MMSNLPKPPSESWYTPLVREEVRPAEPARKKKRGAALRRVLLYTLAAVGLITASSLFFSEGEQELVLEKPVLILPTPPGERFEDDLPESGTDNGFPNEWKDFFQNYYVTDDSGKMETSVPKTNHVPDWELTFAPAGEEELSLQEIYRNCVDSIVAIKSYDGRAYGYFWGSGIIMSEDGLILTNMHLLEDCDSAEVILSDNSVYEAKLVGADSPTDLAVLKIEASGLKPAVFGDSGELSVGESVAAIGNPLGTELRATMTNGIISAIGRVFISNGRNTTLLQTNTAINEGSSGGALVNRYGQVVGVTNMKMMSRISSIEGIAFAIPSATVRSVANSLLRFGEVRGRTAIGITVGSVGETASEHYELPEGLYVSAVAEGSDAMRKGLREGDIITAVFGEPARTTDDILQAKEDLAVGDVMTFTVWRDGESFDVDVILGDNSDIYG